MGVVILAFLGTLVVLGTLAVLHRRAHRQTLGQRTRQARTGRTELPNVDLRIPLTDQADGRSPGNDAGPLRNSAQDGAAEPGVGSLIGPAGDARYVSELRQRYAIADPGPDAASIPLIGPSPPVLLAGAQLGVPEGGPFPGARFVNTPDGEAMITAPPFRARPALFSRRHAAYAHLLLDRLPPWVVLCPKARMDAIVAPTPPDGRDPDDWRTWRRRVRWRAVDLLLCDRRTWRPLLAVIFDAPARSGKRGTGSPHDSRAGQVAGGRDRIVDEVLHAVGVPLVRATGDFARDWPAIEPYVSEAILRSGVVDEAFDRELAELERLRRLGDSAVDLMAIEGDEGFLLK